MKLFKWKTDFKPRFPNIVEKLFGKKISHSVHHDESVAVVPSVNVEDDEKAFEISVALPGMGKDDVQLEIENGILTIRSEKQYSNEERKKNYVRHEFGYAAFQRMFELPEHADPDKVEARMKNGVLHIKVAKKEGALLEPKTIEVG
ncbi:MAG TPA: Hsp20/alpha crystallin family protein [Bacteroidetes bacterium]|nr:Hsp20/alpha crystallin family protein [Bacteroidota bacterium]